MPGDSNDISIGISLTGVETFRNQLREVTTAFETLKTLGGSFGTGTAASLKGLTDNLSGFISGVNTAITRIGALNTAIEGVNRNIRQMNAGMGAVGGGAGSPGSRGYASMPGGYTPGGSTTIGNMGMPFPISERTRRTLTDAERQTRRAARAAERQQKSIQNEIEKGMGKIATTSGGGGGRGGMHDMLYAGGFMLRYKAMSAGLEAAQYGVQDILMGKARSKLATAGRDLTAVGFDQADRNVMEQRAVQLQSKLTGFNTADYFKLASEIASSEDVRDVGTHAIASGTDAAMIMALRSKMGKEQAGRLTASIAAALGETPQYKNKSLGDRFQAVASSVSAGVQHTQAWGGDYKDMFAHALPMMKAFGWDLNTALTFGGTLKTMGFKGGPIGRFERTFLSDIGMQTASRVLMAGGEGQGFGLLQSWHPDAQALFKKYGIKGGGVKQLQEMYGHKAIPIMREMAGADPVSFLEMLSEKFKKGLAAGHLRKDMFKDRQWLSFYEEILGTDFIERFKRDLAKVNETAALGPEGMLKGLQMEHKTEPGMAYQRLEQSAGGFAEAMARAGPLMNAMNRLADVMYIHSQQVMAQKVLESSSSPRQAGRAYQEWMDLEDKKPGWAPSKILPSISKWLGFDAKGVDANMRAMNTDALKEGKEPGFWNTFQQARNILAQAVTGQGFYFDLRDETEGWKKSVPGYSTFQEGERLKALRDPLDPLADIARLGNAGITSSLLLPENSESFQYKNLPEYGFMGQAFSMQEGGQGGFPWSKSPETWLSESTAKADVASAESMSVTAKSVTITAGSVSVSGAVATSGDKGGNELSSGVKQEKWM